MAKDNKTTKTTATAAPTKKGRDRKKRNAAERKCLPKSLKVLFAGSSREMFRILLKSVESARNYRRYGSKKESVALQRDEVSGMIV